MNAAYIEPCPGMTGEETVTEGCGKCMGFGVITWGNVQVALHHRDGSISSDRYCFDCMGRGKVDRKVKNIRAQARRQYKDEQARESDLAKAVARNHALAVQVATTRMDFEKNEPVIAKLAQSLQGDFGDAVRESIDDAGRPREGLYNALVKIAAEQADDPVPAAVVEGRGIISGRIVSTKSYETQYGMAFKMLVLDDRGFKVWGSVPAVLLDMDVAKGDRVSFTAKVEASRDDETFGFYSRPTKASKV